MKLLQYLKDRYNVLDHLDQNEDMQKIFLHVNPKSDEFEADIEIDYSVEKKWNATGFEEGFGSNWEIFDKKITVSGVTYWDGDTEIKVSENQKIEIELELNKQLNN